MRLNFLLISIIILIFSACSTKELEDVEYEKIDRKISYINDIKPILDSRCVSCHSCYNSPCQLKLDAFDGILRGSSKDEVYATRLNAANPTRLFIDAVGVEDWREKGFASVTDYLENNENIMMQFLFQKTLNPEIVGSYSPETDKLTCVQNYSELEDYFNKNPHKAMPYGFPELSIKEYTLLMNWLNQDLVNDSISNISKLEKTQIKKLEDFLNNQEIKHKVSARYIYEHLFLAHIYFDEKSENFFEIIRSKTKSPEKPQIIPTRFPYDEVKEPFYYRVQKVESTIVHKTHLTYKIDDEKLKFYNDIFINTSWNEEPYLPDYNVKHASNALEVFKQIPASSRYRFLLKDVYFIINNFIKGPVCKGQIALNVIQDHFWVAFMDPEFDLSVKDKNFIEDNFENIKIPNELGDDPSLIETYNALKNEKQIVAYQDYKSNAYKKAYPNGLNLNMIWKGNKKLDKNDSILTVYRHFDSASLHYGALGNIPKTLWVFDFPLLERVYYSLVAGFDVFGNTAHQLLVRTHMDRLRVEGESMFLEFLPQKSRLDYFNSWYQGWLAQYLTVYTPWENETAIKYSSNEPKEEFVNMLLDYTKTKRDHINFINKDEVVSGLKNSYYTKQEIEEAFKFLSLPEHSKIIEHFTTSQSNTANIKIKMNNQKDLYYTLVVNRWHKNVALMFKEESRLDPSKDDIDFVEGFVGSYINMFLEVNQNDLPIFFKLLKDYDPNNIEHLEYIKKFSINRANPRFWEVYDDFENKFKELEKLEYGIMDLNRYYEKASDD